ncbi:hypothetical protein ACFLWS_05330, partial [Chloroflexota bacterium]
MKTYFSNATKNQNLLNIILFLALVLVVVFIVSCQSQTPAPAPPFVPDEGTPLAPGEPDEPATLPQIEVIIQGSTFIPDT